MSDQSLPVVIIGAGPVGLAAAAHVVSRHLTPLVLEAGPRVGDGVRRWGHVRMFSPWKFNVDSVAASMLTRHGWTAPPGEDYPTGLELVEQYLEPLAAHARARSAHPAEHTSRDGCTPASRSDEGRVAAGRAIPRACRRIRWRTGHLCARGHRRIRHHRHSWSPWRLGVPRDWETAAAARIFYGIPDVLDAERARYAGRRILVVGSGHSALNALLDLARSPEQEPETRILWAIRRQALGQILGGAQNDQLEERGKLGKRVDGCLQHAASS